MERECDLSAIRPPHFFLFLPPIRCFVILHDERDCGEHSSIECSLSSMVDLLPERILVISTLIFYQRKRSALQPVQQDERHLQHKREDAKQSCQQEKETRKLGA